MQSKYNRSASCEMIHVTMPGWCVGSSLASGSIPSGDPLTLLWLPTKRTIKLTPVLFSSDTKSQKGSVSSSLLMISLWKGSLPLSGIFPDLLWVVSQLWLNFLSPLKPVPCEELLEMTMTQAQLSTSRWGHESGMSLFPVFLVLWVSLGLGEGLVPCNSSHVLPNKFLQALCSCS